jgi:hypothetical protein
MDQVNLVTTILLGFLVLLFYYLLLPKNKYAWGNLQNKSLVYFFIFSIILSAISYMIVWIIEVFYTSQDHTLYTIGNSSFLIGALLWPFFLSISPKRFHLVIFTLCLTSFGSLLILIQECIHQDIVSILFATYLFFHVFFLDNIIWSSSYRKLFPHTH